MDYTKYVLKSEEELKDLLAEKDNFFVVACNKCFKEFETTQEPECRCLMDLAEAQGKHITGSVNIDFLCNKVQTEKKLAGIVPEETQNVVVISCGLGVQTVADLEKVPTFTATNSLNYVGHHGMALTKKTCGACAQCYLNVTGGICPIVDCAKSLVNGQCGGAKNGKCEIDPKKDCAWEKIYQRLEKQGFEVTLLDVHADGLVTAQQVADAIREAHDAGIRTVMITGAHIDTAVAIAKQLGIVTDRSHAITGVDLDRMSDEELDAHIEDYGVYARVQPEHKTRIVEAWKSRDQIVAMTGDGVNDAPSIKRADIGVGMGITGTDVTKNVADMVLADDNFATIIGACEEGRRIYDNIRKVIQFLLSANLAEVFSVFIATLIGFTIFQPVQLLWVNLVTDCFPALALGMEDAEGDIMKRKPRNAKDGVFAGNMGLDCVVQGLIITVLVLASFFVGVYFDMGYIHIADMIAGNADEEGVMMAFITLNMVEIFHCFNMRSRRASLFTMKKQNKWLWASAALALVLTVIVTVQPTLAEMFFGPVTLELKGVIAALGLAFLIIPLMEIYKAIMRVIDRKRGIMA